MRKRDGNEENQMATHKTIARDKMMEKRRSDFD